MRDGSGPRAGPRTFAGWLRAVAAVLATGAIVVCAASAPLAAQEEQGETEAAALDSALRQHRHPLGLEDGELTGPGAELLLEEAGAARYLAVGETHGVAEAPRLVAALFRDLQDVGYRHLAVEIGPIQAERIGELMAGPHPMEAFRGFLADHWPGVPFYSWREEAELLADAVRAGGGAGVLWGLDYDVLGDRYPLYRLRELAPDSAAAAAADRAIALADSLLEQGTAGGDPTRVMMFSQPDSLWRALREAFEPPVGSEADRILFQLAATARINEAWTSGRRWLSNELRVELIKRNFLRYRERAEPGTKVLVKMGGWHLMRGRTPNLTYDVGNLLSELSLAEGEPELASSGSFHLMVVGGPEGKRGSLDPTTWGIRERPTVTSDPEHWSSSIGRAGFDDRWTLLDLRPLRADVARGAFGELPDRLEEMVFAYDAVAVIAGSTAATALEPEGTGGEP